MSKMDDLNIKIEDLEDKIERLEDKLDSAGWLESFGIRAEIKAHKALIDYYEGEIESLRRKAERYN